MAREWIGTDLRYRRRMDGRGIESPWGLVVAHCGADEHSMTRTSLELREDAKDQGAMPLLVASAIEKANLGSSRIRNIRKGVPVGLGHPQGFTILNRSSTRSGEYGFKGCGIGFADFYGTERIRKGQLSRSPEKVATLEAPSTVT